jgi:hypothetical protein
MEKRPGVTGRLGVDPPPATKSPGAAGVVVQDPSAMDATGELEARAREQLKDALSKLMPADANIGLGFNDAWFKRLNSGAVPHTGLNKDFVRKTGVNDVGHRKTLQYSRLVDALNNKRFISPGQAGVRSTYANKGGRSGRGDAITFGNVYKMDGLETAESRAQKRAEGYETTEREREIKRREDVKDMPAALEKLKQLALLDQAGKLTDTQRAEQQQLFTALLHNQYNLPHLMMQDKYRTELGMTQQQYNTELAMLMSQYAAQNGMTTAQYAAMLGMDQARYNSMLGMVMQQFGMRLNEYIQWTTGYHMPQAKVDAVLANPDYLYSSMLGGAFGVGAPDIATRLFAQGIQEAGIDLRNPNIDQTLDVLRRILEAMQKSGVNASNEAYRQKDK